jgi:arylsulfatase A-like enzyme
MLKRLSILIPLIAAAFSARSAQAETKPNIIVIMADDMGYCDVGCYGSEIETPNIDSLARGGVRFTQFYNTARCCPTRASLLTGLYPHQAGMGHMTGNIHDNPGYRAELSHDTPTIPEVLKTAGYSTYMTGKWHVTSNEGPKKPKDNWPKQRGFDRYYGTVKGGGSYYDPAMLTRDNKIITPESDDEYKPEHFYYTDAIGDNATRFVREHDAAKPMFMYVAFTSPHWPLHAPPETIAKYKGKYDAGYAPIRAARFERMKKLGLIDEQWQLSPAPIDWKDVEHKEWEARCMEVYAAQIDRMDQNIGKILATLREKNQLDNTLILFLSDNGGCAENTGRQVHQDRANAAATQPMKPDQIQNDVFPKFTRDGLPIRDGHIATPGGKDSYIAYGEGWANVSNTPFRQYKHFVHEGGISSPLIAHWPAGITRRDQLEKQPGHLIDIMATCVDLAAATPPPTLAGVTLRPAFNGATLARENPIFFEHESNRAVRAGQWKLVAKGIDGPWELYDMQTDRTEMHDLAASQPDRVKQMFHQWQQWAEASFVLPLGTWNAKK